MTGKAFPLLLLVFCLAGCGTLAPDYSRPSAPVPEHWPKGEAFPKENAGAGAPAAMELAWRAFFTDPKLQQVIEIALNNNRDLRLAALNVERARALYGIQRDELYPTIDAVGGGSKQRLADIYGFGRPLTLEQYSVNLGITSWEIDFFGRIRSLKEKAMEEYLATEEARRSAQISLISEVARAYLALAADREHLGYANSVLETQQSSYDLIRRQYEVGMINALDLHRAQTQVETARQDAARYTQFVAQDRNALNLLAGEAVPEELLPPDLSNLEPLRAISPGLSSDVLLKRPDIMAMEHRLKGAYAYIGAARAAFFPRISLTSAVGTASDALSGLFEAGSRTWNFAPQIVLPIFDARTWDAYKVSKAEQKMALAQYEKAIQTAFREVADALAVRGTVDEQLSAEQSLVHALSETHRLSRKRYAHGIDSYLGVLDAQRSLYTEQQRLIALRTAKLANQVTLYAVLGGGGE